MVKKIVLWLLVISCMTAIFCFSGQSSTESVSLSDGMLYDILKFFNLEFSAKTMAFLSVFIRKTAHFSIYALLGSLISLLLRVGYNVKGKWAIILPVAASCAYAITDEVHQLFSMGRSCEVRDVLIDTTGALFGTMLVSLIWRLKK